MGVRVLIVEDERYHENYFAAFVRDPDGYSIEAVCHEPQT
jgi:catechol 2,3-dioxygenase-like lactoylglutathione lyase family enzyme